MKLINSQEQSAGRDQSFNSLVFLREKMLEIGRIENRKQREVIGCQVAMGVAYLSPFEHVHRRMWLAEI